MPHPLIATLAPRMGDDWALLQEFVADWMRREPCPEEQRRLDVFSRRLAEVHRRFGARRPPPSHEELELALTALWALCGQR